MPTIRRPDPSRSSSSSAGSRKQGSPEEIHDQSVETGVSKYSILAVCALALIIIVVIAIAVTQ